MSPKPMSPQMKFLARSTRVVLMAGAISLLLAWLGPPPTIYWSKGSETSPAEFADARKRWEQRPFSNYRLVAVYGGFPLSPSGCRQAIAVQGESVTQVFENTCPGPYAEPRTITGIFDLFQAFVGSGPERVLAADECSYYAVEAAYQADQGYPLYIKTRLLYGDEWRRRTRWFSFDRTLACFTIAPGTPNVTVESLTAVP